MKLKLDAEGKPVLLDGKPVYVHDDGQEAAVDVPALFTSVRSRAEQSQRVENENKELKTQLKAFEGIEDPAAALKALATLKNLDDKKLVDAGEVEKVRTEAVKALEEKYAPIVKERDTLKSELYGERIGGAFSRSKTIAEKFIIPADMVQARFGQHFKVEEGKTVAYDAAGNRIFSRVKPGEAADFEEALEILVSQYPYRDSILKGTGASGSGASGGNQGGGGGKKSMTRAQFDALDPAAKAVAIKEAVLTD